MKESGTNKTSYPQAWKEGWMREGDKIIPITSTNYGPGPDIRIIPPTEEERQDSFLCGA